MRIELRFGVILAFCFTLGVSIAGYISYTLEFRQAQEEVTEKAHVLLSTALSMRSYTAQEITPILQRTVDETVFHPQIVPSYAAQTTMERLRKEFPDYRYHESSLNPTNQADRAADWEVNLFRNFQADPGLKELSGEIGEGKAKRFYVSRALRMTDPACLECHSTPEAAPKAMLAKYGSASGFNWQLGSLIGLQIVEVPVLTAQSKAYNGVLVTVGSLTCVLVLMSAIFLILLRRYVTTPLQAITNVASNMSLDARPIGEDAGPQLDGQFRDLDRSIRRLKTSLDHALRSMRDRPSIRPD